MKKDYFVLLVLLILCGCGARESVEIIKLPENYLLQVEADRSWEYQQPLYYSINKDNVQCVPLTFFGVAEDGRQLSLIQSKQRVVGFAQQNEPTRVVILFNITTGESWPHARPNEQAADTRRRGESMLDVLKTDLGNKNLKLGD